MRELVEQYLPEKHKSYMYLKIGHLGEVVAYEKWSL